MRVGDAQANLSEMDAKTRELVEAAEAKAAAAQVMACEWVGECE